MYILGIDTATRVAGVAVLNEEGLIAEKILNNQKTHSQNLLPLIQQAVHEAGIEPEELGGIAVTKGPGSFTGLRIGMAVAKTMAQVLKLPVKGISTLEALAMNVAGMPGLICPILDARKHEVYAAVYYTREGEPEIMEGPFALPVEELAEKLLRHNREVTFLGDAVPVYRERLVELLGAKALFANKINLLSRAAATAELGLRCISRGDADDLYTLIPTYIRKSEAEVTWEKKNCPRE